MKKLIIAVALMLSAPAGALTIDADAFFAYQKFGPYSASEAPIYTLLSKQPCKAQGGKGWRRAESVVVYHYGQTLRQPFCWKPDTEYPQEAVLLCPVDEKGTLTTTGYLTCMRHLKENYIDTSTLPGEARF